MQEVTQKQIQEDIIYNMEYLNALSKILEKQKGSIDSNLMYEISYAYAYINKVLPNIEDKDLKTELEDCMKLFEAYLDTHDFNNINKKSDKDYIKLLKTRYSNLDDASRAYKKMGGEPMLAQPVVMKSVFNLFLYGIIFLILPFINDFAMTVLSKILGTDAVNPVVNEGLNKLMDTMMALFTLVWLIALMVEVIKTMLTMLYITIPMFRYMISNTSLYKKLGLFDELDESFSVNEKVVRDYNRIPRNKFWLNSMIDSGVFKKLEPTTHDELIKLKSNIKRLENKHKKHSKEYYVCLAQIELYHNKYLSLSSKLGTIVNT